MSAFLRRLDELERVGHWVVPLFYFVYLALLAVVVWLAWVVDQPLRP